MPESKRKIKKVARGFKIDPEVLDLLAKAAARHKIAQIDILEYAVRNEAKRLLKLPPVQPDKTA